MLRAHIIDSALCGEPVPGSVCGADLSSERLDLISACLEPDVAPLGQDDEMLREQLRLELWRLQIGNSEQSLRNIIRLIRATQSPVAYLVLAEAYVRQGVPELALIALDILQYIEPGFAGGLRMRALVESEYGTAEEVRSSARPWQLAVSAMLDPV